MTHWYTHSENLEAAIQQDIKVQALEEIIRSFQKDLEREKDTIRTDWLWVNLRNSTIDVEAENGNTAAVFGQKMTVHSSNTEKAFVIECCYGKAEISIKDNNVVVFDNGTIKFSFYGKTHYVFIPDWNEKLDTLVVTGW